MIYYILKFYSCIIYGSPPRLVVAEMKISNINLGNVKKQLIKKTIRSFKEALNRNGVLIYIKFLIEKEV